MQSGDKDQASMISFSNILLRRGWYIVICLVAVLGPVTYYNRTATPVYEAITTIIYEEPKTPIASSSPYAFYSKESLLNQIEEIKSRSVALEVVSSLPERVLEKIPLPDDRGNDFDIKAFYAAKLRGDIDATPIAESDIIQIKVHANDPYSAMTIANTLCKVLSDRNLNIRQKEVSGVRSLIEEQRDAYKQRLESAESALRQFKESNRVTSLDKEVEEVLRRITQIDVAYKEARADREKTEERLQSINGKIATQRKDLGPSLVDVSTPLLQKLKENLMKLQADYIGLELQGVPQNNPKMVQMRQDMERLRKNLADEAIKLAKADNMIDPLSQISDLYEEKVKIELELETFRTQERSLAGAVSQYEGNLQQLPSKEYELARLTRERDIANNIFVMLSQRREEARIVEAEKAGSLRVIDRAELPKSPIKPRKHLNLAIGLVLGLTIGIGLAFFLESLDTSIKTPEEVEKKIGLSIIGAIPRIRHKDVQADAGEMKTQNHRGGPGRLITQTMPNSPASEAYRALRTNLQFADNNENLRTFMLTSSGPREGKSTTVANLAIATAQMGLRTLVIDGDMRKPTIHRLLGLKREPGLANILTFFFNKDGRSYTANDQAAPIALVAGGQKNRLEELASENGDPLGMASVSASKTVQKIASLDLAITEAVQPTTTRLLDVLTCGFLPPNPSELLASETMKDLLTLVKERYEFVLVDAPPIIAVTDAAVLAPNVDGVALVIESGRNDKEIVLKARSLLDRAGVNVIGAILNNVREKNLYGDYDYYYTYYSSDPSQAGSKDRKNKLPRRS
jgi:uncharacterized protein involved in exopolysaccharide biosynthesis/Mrp family chromosome partitioning ATPase